MIDTKHNKISIPLEPGDEKAALADSRELIDAMARNKKSMDEGIAAMMIVAADLQRFNDQTYAALKRGIEDFRSCRMTMVQEIAMIMAPLKDIRTFFLGADHKEEIARLRDFIELCERLQKLRDSGFLDSIAETMLRLA